MRISLQVAVGYFLIVGLAAWFVLDIFVEEVKPGVRDIMEDTLVDSANLIAELVAPALSRPTEQTSATGTRIATALAGYRKRTVDARIWGHSKRSLDLRIFITDAAGRVIYSTEPDQIGRDYSRWNDIYLTLAGRYGARATRTRPDDESTSVMHVAAPILDRGRIVGAVSVGKPTTSVAPIVEASKAKIRERGLILLVIAALIGGLFTWHLTRAIGRLRRYALAVAAGRRSAPPASRARELSDLAAALAEMRERLEGKQYVERYLHTLTHELKSPLAAIRGAAELLSEADMPAEERARFLANIHQQSDRLAQVAERLLELARIEQQQALGETERIDLDALLRGCVEAAEPLATQRGIRIQVDADGPLRVEGDTFLLGRALANLLDNALRFSPNDSSIMVELRRLAQAKGGETRPMLEIRVSDQGPGLPDYARDRVFERFFSLPCPGVGHKGTGLGLSFVREVAELHGGSIELENRVPNGAQARLRLPRITD
ncbi:signal transduction histidine kinase [Thioflavicoccus mobilis 8321]|uniref:histidine kinase n=1 Tax=Thioflavicoccus mobilis 8321 TaxID=765912 RepID=L0GXW3_9GAMM|nr:two-component system sensor histidine kinase CreC [Thioflavicoccus mobilis]AGA90816.1 signal transduction histidine kinase [Thioflavicoccus mobilis 8321]